MAIEARQITLIIYVYKPDSELQNYNGKQKS